MKKLIFASLLFFGSQIDAQQFDLQEPQRLQGLIPGQDFQDFTNQLGLRLTNLRLNEITQTIITLADYVSMGLQGLQIIEYAASLTQAQELAKSLYRQIAPGFRSTLVNMQYPQNLIDLIKPIGPNPGAVDIQPPLAE